MVFYYDVSHSEGSRGQRSEDVIGLPYLVNLKLLPHEAAHHAGPSDGCSVVTGFATDAAAAVGE